MSRILLKTSLLVVVFIGLVACGGAGGIWFLSRNLPEIITAKDYHPELVTRVLTTSKDGTPSKVIGEFFRKKRYVVPYESVPPLIVHAFISAEDDRFFEHPGIDWVSMIRAALANLRAGGVVQGGSTITQQVTKSLLLTPERSFTRKIKEIILSYRLEKNLKKEEILYLYLNEIYLGHGSYGIKAAARVYFNKEISQITLGEAALLAGMPQAPGKFSPHLNPKKAKERQVYVLKRMLANGYITQNQYNEGAAEVLRIYKESDTPSAEGAHYLEIVKKHLTTKFGETTVFEGGLDVYVPTDLETLKAAHESVMTGLEAVDKRGGYRGPLKKLTSEDEVAAYLKDSRIRLVQKTAGYLTLSPDGKLDPLGALSQMEAKGETEESLLSVGGRYEAVVTSIDDAKKNAGVMVGGLHGVIPFEKMKWAKKGRTEKNPKAWFPDPKKVSEVLHKGDVILAKLTDRSAGKGLIFELTQIPEVQGALFSLEARTGYVLAIEGSYDFNLSKFNRATQSERQPGSVFKPIIYSAALEKGFTPASIIVDSPIVFQEKDDTKWKPANFEEKFYGDTTLRQALIKSRNIPTIKLVQAVEVPKLIEYAKRLGLENAKFNADLSISLGSIGVSLSDLLKVYALFPRLGQKVEPIFVTKVVDREGNIREETPKDLVKIPADLAPIEKTMSENGKPQYTFPVYPTDKDKSRVLDPRVAFVMTHLMTEVVSFGTGYEAKQIGRTAAGKTGTTSDYIDAWFMGFTPTVVTGAWVGYDTQRPIGPMETGAKAALPIWVSFMKDAVKGYPDEPFQNPGGVVFNYIDAKTGKPTPANASSAIREAFIEGTEPSPAALDGGETGAKPGIPGAKPVPSNDATDQKESVGDLFKEDTE